MTLTGSWDAIIDADFNTITLKGLHVVLKYGLTLIIATDADVGWYIIKLAILEVLVDLIPVVGIVTLHNFLAKFKLTSGDPGLFFPHVSFSGLTLSGLQVGAGWEVRLGFT